MIPNINRKISFTLKEYKYDYNILLQEYLSKHEDFEEKQFINLEIDFYNLCYGNANIIKSYYDGKYIYSVNGGNCEILIPVIYDSLVTFKDENDGWDLELSLKYKATFQKIIDYLENKQLGINGEKNIQKLYSATNNELITNQFREDFTNTQKPKTKIPKFSNDVDIVYLNGIFYKNKDILPEIILKTFENLTPFMSLYISEINDEIISTYQDDLEPFENVPGNILIYYYCLESNYINFISKIEDETFIFFDKRPVDLYLFEYAKAFQKGYSSLEEDLNNKRKPLKEPQEQIALKIFLCILNAQYKNGYLGDYVDNLEEFKHKKGRYVDNNDFNQWGFQGGQFYKAWEIILNNPIVFEPLFLKYKQSFTNHGENGNDFFNSQKPHELKEKNNFSNIQTKFEDIKKTVIVSNPKTKKISDKWYALLYLIEVEVYKKEIPTNFEGAFIKSEIEEIGKQRCKNLGQGFYRQVRDLKGNINNNISVKRLFNDNWKDVIIDLPNNDENIIKYLDTYYK
jgi:hypothetical protein